MATARCFCVSTDDTKEIAKDVKNENISVMVDHYRVQSRYNIKYHSDIFRVGYTIDDNVDNTWKSAMIDAINIVNFNAMGIFIYSDPLRKAAQSIHIKTGDITKADPSKGKKIRKNSNRAYTSGNVIKYELTEITLGIDWKEDGRKGTALHELLHALGIHHEHKRHDRNKFGITINEENCNKLSQYKKEHKGIGITMYDPHSIMNYVNCKGQFDVDESNLTVYYANSPLLGKPRINTLSPLDKVGLNLLHPPCQRKNPLCVCGSDLKQIQIKYTYLKKGRLNINGRIACDKCDKSIIGGSQIVYHCALEKTTKIHQHGYDLCVECGNNEIYKPRKSKRTRLYYCGRVNATKGHNYPGRDRTDGKCGPNNGANCASCRVLKNDDIPKKNDRGDPVWQGSSGYFYCRRYYGTQGKGHDGKCGPNNGRPCGSCYKLII